MSRKSPGNIAASVRQRLLNKSRTDKRPFGELLQYYSMERFLYRLSVSNHAKRFILKGALMLRTWNAPSARPTMDIDMLGITSNEVERVKEQVRDICTAEVVPDGLVFDPDSVRGERITEDADYEGIRVRFFGTLDTARVNMQIDIGFGDIVFPSPEEAYLPAILDFPPPLLACYSRESAIAEKFEAMVKLGELNSRMKDFYDIWMLARQFDFDQRQLHEALFHTFNNRRTDLPDNVTAFSKDFISAKATQWKAFRRKLHQESVPENFDEVVTTVKDFLTPVADSVRNDMRTTGTWKAPGPWEQSY